MCQSAKHCAEPYYTAGLPNLVHSRTAVASVDVSVDDEMGGGLCTQELPRPRPDSLLVFGN